MGTLTVYHFTTEIGNHCSVDLMCDKQGLLRVLLIDSLPGHQVCVQLEKQSRDLGFSLEGGVGSSLGDKPLSVQKVFQGESSSPSPYSPPHLP